MIPVSCLLEIVLDKVRYSRDTKLSIGLVLVGVGVCTVTDVSVNTKGFIAAFIAVWSTSLQQYVSSVLYIPCNYFYSKFYVKEMFGIGCINTLFISIIDHNI